MASPASAFSPEMAPSPNKSPSLVAPISADPIPGSEVDRHAGSLICPSSRMSKSIMLSPHTQAMKGGSCNRSKLSLSAARVISRYRYSRTHKNQTKASAAFKINCRCQPKCIVNIVEELNDKKKELISQIGFGGILDLKLAKVNRQFGAWLLSKVDPKSCAIVPDGNKELAFCPKDVSIVFGLPCTGKAIQPCSQEDLELNKKKLCQIFQIPHFSKLTVSVLEAVLKKNYESMMTIDDERAIKAAFVLYIMTKLLAPQSLANNISPRYIRAVGDVDRIKEYNWLQFIVDDLKKAAELMPKRFPKTMQGSINGCIIFLQTLYMDNHEVGDVNITHDKTPRIAFFEDAQVASFIQANLLTKQNPGYPFPQYGKLKLRDVPRAIYARSADQPLLEFPTDSESFGNGHHGVNNVYDFLETQLSTMHVGRIIGSQGRAQIKDIVEDSYGKFEIILEDLSDFVDLSNNRTFIETSSKFRTVINETVTPSIKIAVKAAANNVIESCRNATVGLGGSHTVASSENTGYTPCTGHTPSGLHTDKVDQGDYTPPTYLSASGPANDIEVPSFDLKITQEISRMVHERETAATPDITGSPYPNQMTTPLHTPRKTNVSCGSADKCTSSISPASGTRMTNQCAIMIINESDNEDRKRRTYTVENPPSHLLKQARKRAIKPVKKLMSPFQTKRPTLERLDSLVADALYSYIMSTSDEASLDEIWLQSSHPFKISLKLRHLQETIKMGCHMDSGCLNLAIRLFYRNEVDRFQNTNYLGWRHFINQMYAIAGEEFWEPSHQLAHFSGPEVQYDVSESHMILLPVHFFKHYALYAFDMEHKKFLIGT